MAVAKLLRAGPMQRLSALFLCLMLALSLGFGSVAHAAEGPGVEVSASTSIGHADGDGDQVPADSQRAIPITMVDATAMISAFRWRPIRSHPLRGCA